MKDDRDWIPDATELEWTLPLEDALLVANRRGDG